MLIYADQTDTVEGAAIWAAVRRRLETLADLAVVPHDDLVATLIDLGMVEAAVADALCPLEETPHAVLDPLRRASEETGLAVVASWRGDPYRTRPALRAAAAACGSVTPDLVPTRLTLRKPEGYSFYAVYPEAYADTAFDWAREQERTIVCLGLRSIGTSLSAAVHGALRLAGCTAWSWTLRPHGHPFDRHVAMADALTRRWRPDHDLFLIVDEGPGLSGSSLAGAAAALSALGVPDERIVLMAAWRPNVAQFRSAEARRRWPRHALLTAPFDCVRARVLGVHGVPPDATDLSAGQWRATLECPQPWPAVQPQHERVKLLAGDDQIVRFAGLGAHGAAAWARAGLLAAAGWASLPVASDRGFLRLERSRGVPLTAAAVDEPFVRHAAGYVGWLRQHAATSGRAAIAPLAEMLIVNAREGLGDSAAAAAAAMVAQAQSFDEAAVAVDGRLLPHEWIRTAAGFVKTDAIDHHCDHFLPGRTDAAWDLAGLVVESGLHGSARDACVTRYRALSGDASIAHRLPFYTAAYAAFRLGYCAMAEDAVGAEERQRFVTARARYAAVLADALGCGGGRAGS